MVTDLQPEGPDEQPDWAADQAERPDDLMFEDLRRDDEVLTDPSDVDDDFDASGDASGRSFDALDDRAHAVIGRGHDTDSAELQPDDASVAAQAQSAPRGPDADERPV